MRDGFTVVIAVFVVSIVVLIYKILTEEKWRSNKWAAITSIATIVAACGAISIPMVVFDDAKTTRTLDQLNNLNGRISDAVREKNRLDKERNRFERDDTFDAEYINKDKDVEIIVWKILNDYAYLCLGGNMDLFDNRVILALRRDSMIRTWTDYGRYISQYRAQDKGALPDLKKDAWIPCDDWLKANVKAEDISRLRSPGMPLATPLMWPARSSSAP